MMEGTFSRLIADRNGTGMMICSLYLTPIKSLSLSLFLSLPLTRSPSLLYVTLYSLPIHSYVFNRMREIMLKDLKTSAVKRCSSAKLTLLSFSSLILCLPPPPTPQKKPHSPLSELLSTRSYCSLPQTPD